MENHTPYRIAALILAKWNGVIDAEGEKELENWIRESEKHRELFEKLTDKAHFEQYLVRCDEHDYRPWLDQCQRRIDRGRRFLWLKRAGAVAAVVLLFIFISFFWHNETGNDVLQVRTEMQTIRPGSAYAILTLPGGKTIQLDTLKDKREAMENGIFTVKDTLKYEENMSFANECHTLSVPRGGEYVLKLSDGTKVWLNAESELKYPAVFTGAQRKVFLKGEAYFEVAKQEACPFTVEAGGQRVSVLGTSFGVRAYPEEKKAVTTLEQGSVRVDVKDRYVVLQPGEQAVVEAGSGRMEVDKVDTRLFTAWHLGKFVFTDQPLEEILQTLSRWYNISVFYTSPELGEIAFTGELMRYADIREFLEKIERLEKVRFTVRGNAVTVSRY